MNADSGATATVLVDDIRICRTRLRPARPVYRASRRSAPRCTTFTVSFKAYYQKLRETR